MSAITMIVTETEAPSMVTYTLAPTDIAYGVDRCRGRLFRDEDYDIRWSPPVGRESQCAGRVDEDALCSRCLHNKARWRESCGTASGWWGRVDDPMPARAPTLAGAGWVAEKAPVWRPAPEEGTVEILASLVAECAKLSFDYDCLVEYDEESWPRESENEGLYDDLLKEQAELRRLNKAITDGVILPPAPVPVAPEAETVESLRVKIADMRKKRDGWKRSLDGMLEEGWVISKAVLRAFEDIREKTATAKEILALRAGANAALRARIAALEEEIADADGLNKTLTEQLAGEITRTSDFKAQFEEADFHRRAFEEANERLMELNGRLRAELEEAFAAKRQFSEDLGAALKRAADAEEALEHRCEELGQTIDGLRRGLDEASAAKLRFSDAFEATLKRAAEAEESAELVLTSNAALQCRCDEQEETIDELRLVLRGALGRCADAGELEFLRKEVVTQKKIMRERHEAHMEVKAALDEMVVQHGEMTREIADLRQRVVVAEHEVHVGGEESDDFQRALVHGDDREDALTTERDRWHERFKDLRSLVVETLAAVEPILEREGTMPAGVVLRALSVLK